jgi:dihydrofolate reductase
LSQSLLAEGLVDEFRLSISPVILGQGTPLFEGLADKVRLRLLEARTLKSGVMLLHYETVR